MPRQWPQFFEALANAMSNLDCAEIYARVRKLADANAALHYFHFDIESRWRKKEIDPFTVMGIFNRGQTDAHRAQIGAAVATMLGVDIEPPLCFHGVPHLDPRKSIFDGPAEMLALFRAALPGKPDDPAFIAAWDAAIAVKGNALPTLSMGLFWIRPCAFMAIDKMSQPYIEAQYGAGQLPEKCAGQQYAEYLEKLRQHGKDFPDLAFDAWLEKHPDKVC